MPGSGDAAAKVGDETVGILIERCQSPSERVRLSNPFSFTNRRKGADFFKVHVLAPPSSIVLGVSSSILRKASTPLCPPKPREEERANVKEAFAASFGV